LIPWDQRHSKYAKEIVILSGSPNIPGKRKRTRRAEYDEVVRDIARYIKERLKIEQSAAAFGSL
jgi:hypothetical protein